MDFANTLKLVIDAHNGQTDKAGRPYIEHLLFVAQNVKGEKEKIVALLHDLVEDTDYTFDKLEKMGYTSEVIDAIKAMTKRDGEDYEDYLKRVKNNNIARNVKLADLKHNMDFTRLNEFSDEDCKRLKKYFKAYKFLTD